MNLQFISFEPKRNQDLPEYKSCYSLFESVWAETFRELDGAEEFYSDAYVYADRVGAILFREQVVAVHLYNWHNLHNQINFKLKSLCHYPPEIREWLKSKNVNTLCTLEYFCLSPDYRKHPLINFTRLMGYISLKAVALSRPCATITVTHNLRKVNKLCEALGMSRAPAKEHMLHNVPVDFYYLVRDQMPSTDEKTMALGNKLFEQWRLATADDKISIVPAA